ncbi:MAG: co-chaperone GroES [Rickettsiaceae bacterium]|nr:co-chaperone GroES [Rickettsiaceae bacterium]
MSFVPLHDRVAVKPIESDEKTAGGLIIPDTAKEKPMQGIIVALGMGHHREDGSVRPFEVKVGDKVFYTKWAGAEITINGEKLMVMKESDILGIEKA